MISARSLVSKTRIGSLSIDKNKDGIVDVQHFAGSGIYPENDTAPVNLTLPTIAGTTTFGSTLTVTPGTWSGVPAPTLTRQWQRDGVDIAGATGLTYVLVAADLGTTITVEEDATNVAGSAMAESAGTAIPYVPDYEAGLILDMWAESGVTEAGTGVSSWVSGVGAHNFTQATDSKRPTYEAAGLGGKPSVLWVAANLDALILASGPTSATNNHALIVAINPVSTGTLRALMDIVTGRLLFEMGAVSPASANLSYYDGISRPIALATTGAQILTWVLTSGVGGEIFRGSTSLGTSTYTNKAIGGAIGLGCFNDGSAWYIDARIGRLMLFSTLDAARDARVRAWMSTHYGIAL